MNYNWWDLLGFQSIIGRTNELNTLSNFDKYDLNATDAMLPEWMIKRLDNIFENITNNKSFNLG